MQQPEHVIGGRTYRALSASYAATIPAQLATCAGWSVNAYTGDAWTETHVGWIADAPCGVTWQIGAGNFMALYGGGVYGPRLTYLQHVRSSRQGLRLLAEAHQAALAPPARPRRRTRRERQMAGIADAFLNGGRR